MNSNGQPVSPRQDVVVRFRQSEYDISPKRGHVQQYVAKANANVPHAYPANCIRCPWARAIGLTARRIYLTVNLKDSPNNLLREG